MEFLRSTRQIMRALLRRPAFTCLAAGTLALGIGATTAVFRVANTLLIRPLPVASPDRLVNIYETSIDHERRQVAPANFLSWRENKTGFSSLSAYDERDGNLMGGATPERTHYATVSANYFKTLGVKAVIGRTFRDDDASVGVRAAILRESFWRRRFGGDPSIIGKTLRLDDQTLEVVGVAPDGVAVVANADLYVRSLFDIPELGPAGNDIRTMRDAWYFNVIGRLSDSTTLSGAQSAMTDVAARLSQQYPATNSGAGIALVTLRNNLTGDVRPRVLLLLGAVALVLLIACANVSNLLLVQAVGRKRELALRIAIGADPRRIVGQLFGESLIISLLAAIAGIALSIVFTRILGTVNAPPAFAATYGVPDGAVMLFGLLLSVCTSILFGTIPAVVSVRTPPGALLADRASNGAGKGMNSSLGIFIIAEVSLALVLIIGAGLMLRTFQRLQHVDPGFRAEGLKTAHISIPGAKASNPAGVMQTYANITDRVSEIPNTTGAAVALSGPTDDGPGAGLRIEGRINNEGHLDGVAWQVVSAGYFDVAGIRIIRGREFDTRDRADAAPVALINETFAKLRFHGEDPIGRRINTGLDGKGVWVTIVGVAADTKNEGVSADVTPEMYRPLAQPVNFHGEEMMLLTRSSRGTSAVLPDIRRAVWSVRPDVTLFDEQTGTQLVGEDLIATTYLLRLLGVFALIALSLAAAGIYGVMAYSVRQRMHEIGVRLALGARPRAVVGMVLGQGMRFVVAGILCGAVIALFATRALQAALFSVSSSDPVTFALVSVCLAVAAIAAMLIPAVRAVRMDPLRVLRSE